MQVWFNSTLLPISQSPVDEKGWLPGAGIFETLKSVNGIPWALTEHMVRARKSAKFAQITLPSDSQINVALTKLLTAAPQVNGLLRLSFDKNGNWAAVHLPFIDPITDSKVWIYPKLISLGANVIKTYPYAHRLDILAEANAHGFDEALVINAEDMICEGAVSNIIFYTAGRWITPPISDGVLPGIVRGLVLKHLNIEQAALPVSKINEVGAGILLSSLRVAQPISYIGGRKLPELEKARVFCEQIWAMARRTSVG